MKYTKLKFLLPHIHQYNRSHWTKHSILHWYMQQTKLMFTNKSDYSIFQIIVYAVLCTVHTARHKITVPSSQTSLKQKTRSHSVWDDFALLYALYLLLCTVPDLIQFIALQGTRFQFLFHVHCSGVICSTLISNALMTCSAHVQCSYVQRIYAVQWYAVDNTFMQLSGA